LIHLPNKHKERGAQGVLRESRNNEQQQSELDLHRAQRLSARRQQPLNQTFSHRNQLFHLSQTARPFFPREPNLSEVPLRAGPESPAFPPREESQNLSKIEKK
jgi:hypothetical protein